MILTYDAQDMNQSRDALSTLKKPTQSNLNVFRPSWSDLRTFRASGSGSTKETQAMNEKNQNMNQSRDALSTLKLPDKSGVPTDWKSAFHLF